MNKVKYIKIQQTDGTYSAKIPFSIDGENVVMQNGNNLETTVTTLRNAVGSPLQAAIAASMTDINKIYIYTGNETGYINGNWYYYDGNAWVSGGVYNSTAIETDDTLSVSEMAADAKATGDEISSLKENLENKENWLVGTANQLLSDSYTEDKIPYVFRKTGGDLSVGDREADTIVGGSIVWNQLVQNGNFLDGTNGWGFNNCSSSASGGKIIVSVTSGTKAVNFGINSANAIKQVVGHKYLYSFYLKVSDTSPGTAKYNVTGASYPTIELVSGIDKHIEGIVSATGELNRFYVYPWGTSPISLTGYETVETHDYVMFDITQMFGSTIADYIYSLEQATAGAGVAWFKQYFPADYYEYDPGTLKSIEGLVSHDTVEFNQINGDDVELGYWLLSENGNVYSGYPTRKATVNYQPCLPNTQYRFGVFVDGIEKTAIDSGYAIICAWYDADKNYISGIGTSLAQGIRTSPSNARYMRVATIYASGDIIVNISDPAKNGTYEPYQKHSYTLDSSLTLRGIPKLDANNKMYFDGDIYAPDGTVIQRYGIVDLGTLNWVYNTSNLGAFTSNGLSSAIVSRNIICVKYPLKQGGTSTSEISEGDKWISVNKGSNTTGSLPIGCIIAKDSDYTDAESFKTAMSGVFFVYELVTSTTQTAEPYVPLQICDEYGTEEYVYDSEAFPIPVGHDTKYYVNLRKKIEDGVSDVQINGSSVVTDGIVNVPIASATELGVVKIDTSDGIGIASNSNTLLISKASDAQIKSGNSSYKPIVAGNQHSSTFYGLAKAAGDTTQSESSNAVGTYTEDAKTKIQSMFGIQRIGIAEVIADITTTETADTVTVNVDSGDWPFRLNNAQIIAIVPNNSEARTYYLARFIAECVDGTTAELSLSTRQTTGTTGESAFYHVINLHNGLYESFSSVRTGTGGSIDNLSSYLESSFKPVKAIIGFKLLKYGTSGVQVPAGTRIIIRGCRIYD